MMQTQGSRNYLSVFIDNQALLGDLNRRIACGRLDNESVHKGYSQEQRDCLQARGQYYMINLRLAENMTRLRLAEHDQT